MKNKQKPQWLIWAFWFLVTIGLACALYWRQHHYPSSNDAGAYRLIARAMVKQGFWSRLPGDELRTYGYMFWLTLPLHVARVTHVETLIVFILMQIALWMAVVAFLARSVARQYPSAQPLVLLGSLNMFVIVYQAETLSESISLSLFVLLAAIWYRLATVTRKPLHEWIGVCVGSGLAGYALETRPANLTIVLTWLLAMVLLGSLDSLNTHPQTQVTRRFKHASLLLSAVVCGFLLAFVPQVIKNYINFKHLSIFPHVALGQAQVTWGIQYAKYATSLVPHESGGIGYHNPFFCCLDAARHPIFWYAQHPLRGLGTLSLHIFGFLDQDFLFPFIYDVKPWYRLPVFLVNHLIIVLGIMGLVALYRRAAADNDPVLKRVFWLLMVFIALSVGIHALTAVEVRFGLPILCVLGFFTPLGTLSLKTMRKPAWFFCGVLLYLFAAWSLSQYMSTLRVFPGQPRAHRVDGIQELRAARG